MHFHREFVRQLLRILDPHGVVLRKQKCLKRRIYLNKVRYSMQLLSAMTFTIIQAEYKWDLVLAECLAGIILPFLLTTGSEFCMACRCVWKTRTIWVFHQWMHRWVGHNTTYIMIVNQDTHCHVCRYSRKLIWLAVEPANHNPVVTFYHHMYAVAQRAGLVLSWRYSHGWL